MLRTSQSRESYVVGDCSGSGEGGGQGRRQLLFGRAVGKTGGVAFIVGGRSNIFRRIKVTNVGRSVRIRGDQKIPTIVCKRPNSPRMKGLILLELGVVESGSVTTAI